MEKALSFLNSYRILPFIAYVRIHRHHKFKVRASDFSTNQGLCLVLSKHDYFTFMFAIHHSLFGGMQYVLVFSPRVGIETGVVWMAWLPSEPSDE